jgi:hypothetical protein
MVYVAGMVARLRALRHVPAAMFAAALLLELAIALPFVYLGAASARGVPGPALLLVGVAASYLLGWREGVAVTAIGAVLAVTILGENRYAAPPVWIAVAAAVGVLGERVRLAERATAELQNELQAGLVALSADPATADVDVRVRYRPAEERLMLAGDFYGVLEREGTVSVLVGDVSGHGPRAAAVGTHLRAAWRGLVVSGARLTTIMRVLNETMFAEQAYAGPEMFATVCMGRIDPDRSTGCFLVAGHPPPIHVRGRDVDPLPLPLPPSPALGIVRDIDWPEHDVVLPAAGWSLVFFTDGLIEGRAQPGSDERFGVARLLTTLREYGSPLIERHLDDLIARVQRANGGPIRDDVVILAISPTAAGDAPSTS